MRVKSVPRHLPRDRDRVAQPKAEGKLCLQLLTAAKSAHPAMTPQSQNGQNGQNNHNSRPIVVKTVKFATYHEMIQKMGAASGLEVSYIITVS